MEEQLMPKFDNPDMHGRALARITAHLQQASLFMEKQDKENHCAFLTSHEHRH